MPEVVFVMSPGQDANLRELAETLCVELGLQGVPASVRTDGFPEPRPGLVYGMVGLRDFLELEGEARLADTQILHRCVLIENDGPAEATGGSRYRELLAHFGVVFNTDVRSVLALHRVGIGARTLRPGYSAGHDRFDAEAPRPVDVLVTGAASKRRRHLLAQYGPILARHNCLIRLQKPGDRHALGGRERLDLLARTRVMLALHADGAARFDWTGALDAIHCGAVVVSEQSSGMAPFEPGEHLLTAGADALPYVVDQLLNDTVRQDALRRAAYERLSRWLPYGLSIGVLRAAVVELVGRPVDPGVRRPRDFTGGGSRPRWEEPETVDEEAAATDERLFDRRVTALLAEERFARHAERSAIQAELAGVQRTLAALAQATAVRDGVPVVRVVAQTPHWAATRDTRTGIILAVGDDAPAVSASLHAVAKSLTRDFRVVAAGRSGRGLDAARAWCVEHPRVAARVLELGSEPSPGAARNAALDHLGAQHCLVITTGDRILPRCLEVLDGTLDALEAALVYPICAIDRPGQDGELINYRPWEPSELRSERLLTTPYLVRTQSLRDVGGFAVSPELSGWEDYDLLCRFGATGLAVHLVPQILAVAGALGPEQVLGRESIRRDVMVARAPALLAGLSAG